MFSRKIALIGLVALVGGVTAAWRALEPRVSAQSAATVSLPTFKLDTAWPQKLPNGWVMGPVASIGIDQNDHAWFIHRSRLVADNLKAHAAPPVIEFDAAGKFVRAWGGPGAGYEWPDNEHGIYVDDKGSVWIAGNAGPGAIKINEPWRDDDMLLKFSREGKFERQFGHRDKSRGNKDTANVREPADVSFYPKTNEVFIADGYGNRRIVVLDAQTLTFKRMWGAFGKEPLDVFPLPPVSPDFKKGPPPPKTDGVGPPQYWIIHSVRVSNDGFVYVGDREYGRVQVFDLAGKYLNQVMLRPADAWAFCVSFSPDAEQRLLYIADGKGRIVFVDRKSLQTVGEFKIDGLSTHHMSVDSKGNVYFARLSNEPKRLLFTGMKASARP